MKKVIIVNDQQDMGEPYYPFFNFVGPEGNLQTLDEPENVALIVFTGGADVHPSFYKENTNPRCYCDKNRDVQEIEIFSKALKNGIPMFGICRGAQFLCVMEGGSLVQHTTGHQKNHSISTIKSSFEVSSAHHQMMMPIKESKILAWTEPKLSSCYLGGNDNAINYNMEVEVVEFSLFKGYGVQYHPEIMDENSEGSKYCKKLIRKLLRTTS